MAHGLIQSLEHSIITTLQYSKNEASPPRQLFLGLGTNLGEKAHNLSIAQDKIAEHIGVVTQASPIYTTDAWGIEDQDRFLNQVLQVETTQDPFEVLRHALAIEKDMGRKRIQKWGERLIDIDLLFYDDVCIERSQLIIPHPFIAERRFVLVPMLDLAPEWLHPIHQKTIAQLLESCPDPLKVERFLGQE